MDNIKENNRRVQEKAKLGRKEKEDIKSGDVACDLAELDDSSSGVRRRKRRERLLMRMPTIRAFECAGSCDRS